MLLHHIAFTPSSRKVRMFLHEKGITVPMLDVADGFALSSDYTSRYPHRMVPMLELDDGTQIGEAMAICRYFETLHPDPPLMGTDPRDRATVEMWERRAYNEGMGAVEEVFRNSHPLMVDRGLPGTDQPVPQIPALVERGQARFARFLDKFDAQLAERHFVAGERFTVADVATLCVIDFGRWCQIEVPDRCTHLRRWYADVSARPGAAA